MGRQNAQFQSQALIGRLRPAKVSKSLIPAQRQEIIQEYLSLHRIVRSADLSQMLEVSEATIRRDLEWLESQGFLERTHGGAILSQRMPFELEYVQRVKAHPEEKRLIGIAAAKLIEEGDVVFINSGTTTSAVIRHIPRDKKITLITNNLSAAIEVGETGFEFLLLGGAFQPMSNSVAGRFAVETLRNLYANKAFFGVDGISPKYNCTMPSNAEAEVVRLMLERTLGPKIVVADHSKWGVVSSFEVARIENVQKLITDRQLNADARSELAARNVEVVIADDDLGTEV
jgi:DeoR family transcriptional regulator of aga operon